MTSSGTTFSAWSRSAHEVVDEEAFEVLGSFRSGLGNGAGDCQRDEVRKNLVPVVWLPKKWGKTLQVTRVNPRRSTVRVRGLASSGANYGYGPYGVGAYGAVGYGYAPDLSFRCDVDYRGYVRNVDIDRRR